MPELAGEQFVVVLTALDLEYQAVRAHLTDVSRDSGVGTVFRIGSLSGAGLRIVLASTGDGNLTRRCTRRQWDDATLQGALQADSCRRGRARLRDRSDPGTPAPSLQRHRRDRDGERRRDGRRAHQCHACARRQGDQRPSRRTKARRRQRGPPAGSRSERSRLRHVSAQGLARKHDLSGARGSGRSGSAAAGPASLGGAARSAVDPERGRARPRRHQRRPGRQPVQHAVDDDAQHESTGPAAADQSAVKP